jgi:protein-L-isoaspartate(D-aspartate) O-methyltransferase
MTDSRAREPDEHATERRRMVEEQLVARGIYDRRVLEAMARVPRHLFVASELESRAYADAALPSIEGQTISQPWIVARMLELCDIGAGDRVLEIGTGTGYQTALLSLLAAEVYSIERMPGLHAMAGHRLAALGCGNVRLLLGDGTLGWQEFAPYARVLAAAAAPHVPNALLQQLGEGGVLVIPVGGAWSQSLEVWRRQRKGFLHERYDECRFVPLIGQDAWRVDPHHN